MSWVSLETAEDEGREDDEEDREDDEEDWEGLGFLLTVWLVDVERPFCPDDPDVVLEEVLLFEVSFDIICTSLGFSEDVDAVSLGSADVEGLGSAIWLIILPTTSEISESKMAASLVSASKFQ